MYKYNHKKIESKWQKKWQDEKLYQVDLDKAKKPFYNLMMFPYPSAEGLHVGNMYAFVHSDTYGRFMRLKGYDVFEPIGLDGFGIHSENYAIKIGEHIKDVSERTEKHFYKQLHQIGNAYDWSRTIETYKPNYYKWTQWLFLKMYEKGLAYRKKSSVNWCPSCKTVLSDEQVISGKCERCDSETEKKQMEQWFWRITDYAEKLLKNLDVIDWSEEVKAIQRNWIGKSEGTKVKFAVIASRRRSNPVVVAPVSGLLRRSAPRNDSAMEVFTTRPDTLFGCTYMVVCPEHELIMNFESGILNLEEVKKYITQAQQKSDLERTDLAKEKTGVELKGVKAINPVNNEEIPIFVADYVLAGYGTGAIMAVPAHDERDFEFAKKYNLPIKEVVIPIFGNEHKKEKYRETITALIHRKKDDKFLYLDDNYYKKVVPIIGGIKKGESIKDTAKREVYEETGYKIKFVKKLGGQVESHFFASHKNVWRYRLDQPVLCELLDEDAEPNEISEEEKNKHKITWLTAQEALKRIAHEDNKIGLLRYLGKCGTFCGEGRNISSDFLDGLKTKQAINKMNKWLEEKKVGKGAVNYKLRDWCISRQRYWGPPIPMIKCDKCGWITVQGKDLPVELPEMDDFLPDGSGKGPLNKIEKFVNTTCPKCGGPAKRETDVSDPFVDSCWYYMRYLCTEFNNKALDKKRLKKWLPIDMYIGGKEHSVLHLLYSRFVTMVMHELGYAPEQEPFKKFRAHGLLIRDGAKISKSKNNIVNPDEYIEKYGADAVRMYLMFIGDMRQGGDWRDTGMAGMYRFVNRIWNVFNKINSKSQIPNNKQISNLKSQIPNPAVSFAIAGSSEAGKSDIRHPTSDIRKLLHKTIKGVGEDLENLKYNTAISKLMVFVNKIQGVGCSSEEFGKFLILLAPFAPHLAEELYARLQNGSHGAVGGESIFKQKWPKYDPELVKDEIINLVVQINGKLRDTIEAPADISEDEAKKAAMESEKIKKWVKGKEVVKVIFVKGKLVNIVVK